MKKILGFFILSVLLVGAGCNTTKTTTLPDTSDISTDVMGPTTSSDTTGIPTDVTTEVTPDTTSTATTPPVMTTTSIEKMKTYTMAEVKAANKPENCLSAINGIVYDLTAWINKHPGGDKAVLSICGMDGTAKFEGKHGGQAQAENTLAGFEVGKVK